MTKSIARAILLAFWATATPSFGLTSEISVGQVKQLAKDASIDSNRQIYARDALFPAELGGDAHSIPTFTTVRVAGIFASQMNHSAVVTSFLLPLRSSDDIAMAQSPYWRDSVPVLMAGLLIIFAGGAILLLFERRYGAKSADGSQHIPTAMAIRFQSGSKILAWVVFSVAMVSLTRLFRAPLGGAPEEFIGHWIIRLALALAALAVCWNSPPKTFKDPQALKKWFSLIASSLIFIGGTYVLWQYQTSPASAAFLNSSGIPVAAAFCLCFLGLSLLLTRLEKLRFTAQLFAIAVSCVALLNLINLLYGTTAAQGIARYSAMPSTLAAGFYILSLAVLFSTPSDALMRIISAVGMGGLVCRRLLPAALLIPVLMGWLRLQGLTSGLYDPAFGMALFATGTVLSFGALIWASAAILNRQDAARSQAEAALRERDQRLELLFGKSGIGDFTLDLARDKIRAHPILWRLYGLEPTDHWTPAALLRRRYHPDDAAMVASRIETALSSLTALDYEFRIILPDGGIRWICCRGNILRDDSGEPTFITGLHIDITQRKRSEAILMKSIEATRAADQRLQTGLEYSKVAVWRWYPAKDEITWEGPVEAVYGKRASELSIYSRFRECVHPEDIEKLEATITSSLDTGTDFRAQFRIIVDDKIRWIAARGGVMRDDSGMIHAMSGVNFDITSTKVAEAHLRESERSFRELADAMPQIVWITNPSGQIHYYNRRWYEYTGDTDGHDLSYFVHPDDFERADRLWRKSLADGTPFTCERRLKSQEDGIYRWHLSRAVPVTDDTGSVISWFGTSTDIDDYKRIQAEIQSLNRELEQRVEQRSAQLAEIELRYRLLVDGVKDYAIFMMDQSGHIASWNKGAEQLTGYSASEVMGEHFSKFHRADAVSLGQPGLTLSEAATFGHHSEEGWRVRKDGSEFWASVVTTPLRDSTGKINGFSKIIRDMTEQRNAMSMLIAESQKAVHANQAKSNFLASMSHEIRTPMNAILGMADLLAETELDETQREYVHRFQRAGSNLMAIINDILDLSKIESGHFELEEVPLDLEEVCQRVVDLVAPKAHRKNVNLAYRIVPGLETVFIGDPMRLQQILLNLLGNAAKFTERGEIVLTVRPHQDRAANHIEFEIADTGIGIPADKISTIFEDFTQAESSTTRRFGGTGLGLGISRRLVQRMGGTLRVQSELGKGSTFTFDALFREAGKTQISDQRPTVVPGVLEDLSRHRVLVVDASHTNRIIYREMCSFWTMRVDATESARQAVSLLQQAAAQSNPFSIVLLDRFSADLEAFETLRLIRSAGLQLPVILTTAEDQPGEATRATIAGFAGYLVKPIRRANLLRMISTSLIRSASPVNSRESPGDNVTHMSRLHKEKVKILVADDSEDNRFLIEAYLAGTCYEAAFATDGKLAIEQFNSHPFDLILMDVQMPVMDGLQATAAIRALERKVGHGSVPIIALTASVTPEDIDRSHTAGCNAHLSKPISKIELLRVLDEFNQSIQT